MFHFNDPARVIKPGALQRELACMQDAEHVTGLLHAAVKKYGSLEAIPKDLGDYLLNEINSVLSARAETEPMISRGRG